MPFTKQDIVKIAISLKESTQRSHELAIDNQKRDLQRYVWFVAIGGFILFNSLKISLEHLLIDGPTSNLRILVIVWMTSVLLSISTILLYHLMVSRDILYFSTKMADIDSFITFSSTNGSNQLDLLKLIDENDEKVKELKDKVERVQKFVNFFEIITSLSLIAGILCTGVILFQNL